MVDETQTADRNGRGPRVYDLEERMARFGEAIVAYAKRVPRNVVTLPLIKQLVRAGTSVGANYCEADGAVSPKDFRHIISISKKESRETMYWLRMIVAAEPRMKEESRTHWREAKELHLIFASIWRGKK
ncbi:MAG: four helix bundle protein [Thermoguttaceae bacterium]